VSSDDPAAPGSGFAGRYGPWALVAGASDGVGLAYARAMAERGLGVGLVARRQSVLDDVAAELRQRFGVPTRALTIDLSEDDAVDRLVGAVDDLEMFERNQAGLSARVDPWLILSRGRQHERRDEDGTLVAQMTDEVTQRGIWRQWKKMMTQGAEAPARRQRVRGAASGVAG